MQNPSCPRQLLIGVASLALALHSPGRAAHAQVIEFVVDQSLSSLNLVPATFSGITVASGTRLTSTIGVQQQFAGSLNGRMSGKLFGTVQGGSLTLTSQSFILGAENVTGPFVPPSNLTGSNANVDVFGARAVRSNGTTTSLSSTLAIRDIRAEVASGTLTPGAAASLQVQVTDGTIDLVDPPFEQEPADYYFYDFEDIVTPGAVPNSATQAVTGSFTTTLSIPYSLSYTFSGGGRVDLAGTVVAHRVGLPIPGDFNLNGSVGATDLTKWRGDFKLNANSNADGDSDSDGNDFLIWQRNLGKQQPVAIPAPEPGASLLIVSALLATMGSARRASRQA
jgi:hypothetical protein